MPDAFSEEEYQDFKEKFFFKDPEVFIGDPVVKRLIDTIDADRQIIAEQKARIGALEQKLKDPTVAAVHGFEAGKADAQSRIASLEAALEFYAQSKNYINPGYDGMLKSPIAKDMGTIARAAREKGEGDVR